MRMEKILLIVNQADIAKTLSVSLKAEGYAVVRTRKGMRSLGDLEKEKPDIVIADIRMPGMEAIAIFEKIKALAHEAEVIVITDRGDTDTGIKALGYGASDYIERPIRNEALSIVLKRAREKLEAKRRLREIRVDLEKKIEAATRELWRRSKFQIRLIQSSNDGIVATDENLNIVIFNPCAEKIFGVSADEAIGKLSIMDLYPAQIAGTFQKAMKRRSRIKDLPWQEARVVSKSGKNIPVRFSGTVLMEKAQKMGTVAFFQDLREIKNLEDELVRSERLAAIGQTVAGLAHGIKNILHGLKGGSYLVDIGIEKNKTDKLKRGWEMIKRNIGRTSNLVQDLLSYAKERAPEYQPCAPNEIAAEVCALIAEKAAENNISVVTDLDACIGEVSMDPDTIHEVLLNLMSNAIDACLFDENTSKSWRVQLKTKKEKRKYIQFVIADNGIGMSEDIQQRLFTSFFSTKGHRGTGLGLMVTRKLVEEHGGSIRVSSKLNAGTTFTVKLPYEAVV